MKPGRIMRTTPEKMYVIQHRDGEIILNTQYKPYTSKWCADLACEKLNERAHENAYKVLSYKLQEA